MSKTLLKTRTEADSCADLQTAHNAVPVMMYSPALGQVFLSLLSRGCDVIVHSPRSVNGISVKTQRLDVGLHLSLEEKQVQVDLPVSV